MKGRIGFPVWTALIVVVAGVALLLDALGAVGGVPRWVLIVFIGAGAYLVLSVVISPFVARTGFCPHGSACPFRTLCPFSR